MTEGGRGVLARGYGGCRQPAIPERGVRISRSNVAWHRTPRDGRMIDLPAGATSARCRSTRRARPPSCVSARPGRRRGSRESLLPPGADESHHMVGGM